jgi:hypothetical protein
MSGSEVPELKGVPYAEQDRCVVREGKIWNCSNSQQLLQQHERCRRLHRCEHVTPVILWFGSSRRISLTGVLIGHILLNNGNCRPIH